MSLSQLQPFKKGSYVPRIKVAPQSTLQSTQVAYSVETHGMPEYLILEKGQKVRVSKERMLELIGENNPLFGRRDHSTVVKSKEASLEQRLMHKKASHFQFHLCEKPH